MTAPSAESSGTSPPSSSRDEREGEVAAPSSGTSDAADDASRGEQSWRNLLELDAQLFNHKNVRLLTPEARVLIHLKLEGSMPVSAAMQLAGVSYRGFYAVLERLKQAGLVGQNKDNDDQRVRNLTLDPSNPIPPARF